MRNPQFLTHWEAWLTIVGILWRMACLAVLFRRGMAVNYKGLACYLALSAARGVFCVWSGCQARTGYFDAFWATHWYLVAAKCLLVLDAQRLMARHFRGAWMLAAVLAICGSMVGFGASYFAAFFATADYPVRAAVLLDKQITLVCICGLLVSRGWFFGSPQTTMRPNTRAHVNILLLYLIMQFTAGLIRGVSGVQYRGVIDVANVVLPATCYALWARRLSPQGEAEPRLRQSTETLRERDAADRQLLEDIRREADGENGA